MQNILDAIGYIEEHLDEKLDLETLSMVAGYSKYHFCRIFQAYTGEGVMEHITRLRLQRATIKISDKNKNLLNVALECGYQSQSGFIRAFEKMFLRRPKDFRKQQEKNLSIYEGLLMGSFEIVNRDDVWVVYSRALGDYDESGDKAWVQLSEESKKACEKILSQNPDFSLSLTFDNSEILGVCYDNPDTTETDKIRYEACVGVSDETAKLLNGYGMQTKTLKGGRFARLIHKGSNENIKEVWLGFYKRLCDEGYTIRDEPPFEKYVNNPAKTPVDELLTEIYIGVE